MLELIAAATCLIVTHYGISSTGIRPWLVGRIGEPAYLGLYSVIAFAAIFWVASAYGRAPYVEVWPLTPVAALVPLVLMPIALVLVVGGLTVPNPTAVGAPDTLGGEQPARGVLRITRHPFMWGTVLWALAHMVPNGDLAAIILFATFGLLALLGTVLLDHKYAARRGADWARFAGMTSNLPFAAIAAGRQRLVLAEIGWWRLVLALVIYLALLAIHPWLFGVSPVIMT